MPIPIKAWKCVWCKGLWEKRKICDRHEIACIQNPNGRNCYFCIHSAKDPNRIKGSKLKCLKYHHCSQAVSALCEDFERKPNNENWYDRIVDEHDKTKTSKRKK